MSTERSVVQKLVEQALAQNFLISVHDGGEWVVKASSNKSKIMGALFTTDEEWLRFRDRKASLSNSLVGDVYLVYGNAEDGSEVISDYTDNETMKALVDAATP